MISGKYTPALCLAAALALVPTLLHGYLAAQPKGAHAKDAGTLLLALGGNASATAKVAVKAKVDAKAKAKAGAGDAAMKAGKYIDAAQAYGEAHELLQKYGTGLFGAPR